MIIAVLCDVLMCIMFRLNSWVTVKVTYCWFEMIRYTPNTHVCTHTVT